MGETIEFRLNGRAVRLADMSPNLTLLEYLRGQGLTGSKEGCAEGDCGACSVVIADHDSHGRACYRSINSCLVPVCLMAGRDVISVEGVVRGDSLHPIQQKMIECHGSQCGYCTPGFIMSLFEGFYREDIRTQDQLDDQICGNLCRCTGYRAIRQAAIEAFSHPRATNGKDSFLQQLKQLSPVLGDINYRHGEEHFLRPASVLELLRSLKRYPDGRVIAGATELGLDITKRYRRFTTLISVESIPELGQISCNDSEWRIGAAATLTQIEEKMGSEFPPLGRMLRVFGSRQIRNRATMGGNIVTASPIGDSAPVLLVLDAKVVLASLQSDGPVGSAGESIIERTLPIEQFFLAYRKTALQPGEVLKTIVVPRFQSEKGIKRIWDWQKVSRRREMDISTVAACFRVETDNDQIVREARLAYGGVAAMPLRAKKTEEAMLGKPWNSKTVDEVLPVLSAEFTPISDVRGEAEFRAALIGSLFQKFYHSEGTDRTPVAKSAAKARMRRNEFNGRISEDGLLPDFEMGAIVGPKASVRALPHESAHKHVTGEALYTDDLPSERCSLEAWPVCAPHAHARIIKRDASFARAMPGIRAVLMAEDVPGGNDVGSKHDEVLLPDKQISYRDQIVALVVGDSQEQCRAAAAALVVDYEPLPPILTFEQAIEVGSYHNEPNFIRRGNVDDALKRAPLTVSGTFELGGQEHFYLETHAALAEPGEDNSVMVRSSTQHPSEVQSVVAHALGVSTNKVVVQCARLGGGFGGKETQAALPAALAALAAHHTGRPVRVRFNRDQDMAITGHRHPFLARFDAGFDKKGTLLGARIQLLSNGGWAQDLSQAVTDRALFHLDNAYYIPSVELSGRVAKTNLSSNTAFRGFGGPQGMLVIEEIIDRIARRLGLPPEKVRERNLYRGTGKTRTTHYGQLIDDNRLQTIWHGLLKSSKLTARRKEIDKWNSENQHRKRGIAITPVKFGISFTVTHLNQAGALVLVYQDGTIQVNHGGTEMGQGVHTNIAAIAAREFGLSPDKIRVMHTSTDKVPNTSATAASCGTDLNGAAVRNACEILRGRLAPIAVEMLQERIGRRPRINKLIFARGLVFVEGRHRSSVKFSDAVKKAYLQRVNLSANGFHATPGIHWDRAAGRGKPFHYFANGAAVTEVEVDCFTGMMNVLRTDILHDVGDSINEGINRGQIEGGFVQGMGWLTMEELKWNKEGRLLTHSPDTYKIPSVGDIPKVFNVAFLKKGRQRNVIYGSKAVGEPPLMLAISVREAIRDAIAAFGPQGGQVPLASPATSEAIFKAIQQRLGLLRPEGSSFGRACPSFSTRANDSVMPGDGK
jgi:xanthine dehydrogenase molybdopterin binding subunit/xanthine dehydrogenase small subunit